jgi:hypothetical protein
MSYELRVEEEKPQGFSVKLLIAGKFRIVA